MELAWKYQRPLSYILSNKWRTNKTVSFVGKGTPPSLNFLSSLHTMSTGGRNVNVVFYPDDDDDDDDDDDSLHYYPHAK